MNGGRFKIRRGVFKTVSNKNKIKKIALLFAESGFSSCVQVSENTFETQSCTEYHTYSITSS